MLARLRHINTIINTIYTIIRKKHFYTKTHELINYVDDNTVKIGISDYAKDKLGEIVFIDIEDIDTTFEKHDEIAMLESTKATSALFSPSDGTIISHNTDLIENIEGFCNKNELDSWLLEFKLSTKIDDNYLLNKDEYSISFCCSLSFSLSVSSSTF